MAEVTKEFTREQLQDMDLPFGAFDHKWCGDHRWSVDWCGIFEYENSFWKIYWQVGATEYQDDTDFWYDEDTVEAIKVELIPRVVEEWVAVDV